MSAELKPCPFCGASAFMAREHDPDDIAWSYVRCRGCGVSTRGKWYSAGNDCPLLYEEVRDEWNTRAASGMQDMEAPSGYVLVRLKRPEGYEDVHPELILEDANINPAFEPELAAATSPNEGGK
jgi:hypothetical protein